MACANAWVRYVAAGSFLTVAAVTARPAAAQIQTPAPAGVALPDSDRMRVTIDILAGYGSDRANATLGFEQQGRIGYAIVTAFGRVARRLSYRISINPIEETTPRPACGATNAFYPNDPRFLYGDATEVPCDPRYGNRRVDAYRGIALDVVPQQGAIREALIEANVAPNTMLRFGRMRLPVGFDWQEAGSMTAKDALMIQRIDAQANFGVMLTYDRRPARGLQFGGSLAAHLGDTNRWFDYDYFYFEDGSFGTNSQFTYLASGRIAAGRFAEFRGAYQNGSTGSKVERRPSYWASKRNDNALILSLQVRPITHARLLIERARYTWGPRASSALMVGVDPAPIVKNGYYLTAEGTVPLGRLFVAGVSASYERIDRADSLVRWLAQQDLYSVTMGRHDERLAFRTFVDVSPTVRVGFYRTLDRNPFPWVSGITAAYGPDAPHGSNTDKWGVTARLAMK